MSQSREANKKPFTSRLCLRQQGSIHAEREKEVVHAEREKEDSRWLWVAWSEQWSCCLLNDYWRKNRSSVWAPLDVIHLQDIQVETPSRAGG